MRSTVADGILTESEWWDWWCSRWNFCLQMLWTSLDEIHFVPACKALEEGPSRGARQYRAKIFPGASRGVIAHWVLLCLMPYISCFILPCNAFIYLVYNPIWILEAFTNIDINGLPQTALLGSSCILVQVYYTIYSRRPTGAWSLCLQSTATGTCQSIPGEDTISHCWSHKLT